MLFNIIIGVGAFLMLSLILGIFIGSAIYKADVMEGWADEDDEY